MCQDEYCLLSQTRTSVPFVLLFGLTSGENWNSTAKMINKLSFGLISSIQGVITTVGNEQFPVNYIYRLSIRVVDRNAAVPETSFADMLLLVYTAFQPVQFPMPIFQVNISEELPPETM